MSRCYDNRKVTFYHGWCCNCRIVYDEFVIDDGGRSPKDIGVVITKTPEAGEAKYPCTVYEVCELTGADGQTYYRKLPYDAGSSGEPRSS